MTITMILSLFVCTVGLTLVATAMALPVILLPDEPEVSPGSQHVHRRFPGKTVTVRA